MAKEKGHCGNMVGFLVSNLVGYNHFFTCHKLSQRYHFTHM